jgi:hypothetical protein
MRHDSIRQVDERGTGEMSKKTNEAKQKALVKPKRHPARRGAAPGRSMYDTFPLHLPNILDLLRPFVPLPVPEAFYSCDVCAWRLIATDPNAEHPETLYCPKCRKEMQYHGPKSKLTVSQDGVIDVQAEDVTLPRIEGKP